MAERTVAPDGLVNAVDEFPLDVTVLLYHHLAYAVAVIDHKGLIGEIDHDDAYVAQIVSFDIAG